MLCAACEDGDHAHCGMQTWCECECDPELALLQDIADKSDYEEPVIWWDDLD